MFGEPIIFIKYGESFAHIYSMFYIWPFNSFQNELFYVFVLVENEKTRNTTVHANIETSIMREVNTQIHKYIYMHKQMAYQRQQEQQTRNRW